jgi:hypothetical protein
MQLLNCLMFDYWLYLLSLYEKIYCLVVQYESSGLGYLGPARSLSGRGLLAKPIELGTARPDPTRTD